MLEKHYFDIKYALCDEYGKITLILNILFICLSFEYMDYVFIWLLAY